MGERGREGRRKMGEGDGRGRWEKEGGRERGRE